MDMFATDEAVAALESALLGLQKCDRLPVLVALAWHLRQRDTRRALELASEAEELLAVADLVLSDRHRTSARLCLVAAEAKWLFAELDQAKRLAHSALDLFGEINDRIGCADCHWLMSAIAADSGSPRQRRAEMELAVADARLANDKLRANLAEVAMAITEIYHDARAAESKWRDYFGSQDSSRDIALVPWDSEFWGALAYQTADFERAIKCRKPACVSALATGQVRRAILCATNIGATFTSLNDPRTALEWMKRGLEIARPTGWPSSIGLCQLQTAETLRHLGQWDGAQEQLDEALNTLRPLANSRTYAIALHYLGDLQLDRGNFAAALLTFRRLEERASTLCHPDLHSIALRGQAHALSSTDKPEDALVAAENALNIAKQCDDAASIVAALFVLAEIYSTHASLLGSDHDVSRLAIQYLHEALDIAAAISGFVIPKKLFDALARTHASVGEYETAYKFALEANLARERIHSQEAANRAISMQIRETERAQEEAAFLRQIAAKEAERAESLHLANSTLEKLGIICQEITGHLDIAAVIEVLGRQVRELLDTTCFAIYLLSPDGQTLSSVYDVEDGKPLPASSLSILHPTSYSAQCVRERREVVINLASAEISPNHLPGTIPTLSMLFAPLLIGERVIGLMTIQSPVEQAYSSRERLIFRTLSAYGAIAIDNSVAYRKLEDTTQALQETQRQLSEKNQQIQQVNKALEEISLTDPLTGLNNRRFLLKQMDQDAALAIRHREKQSHFSPPVQIDTDLLFLLVDVDHFKRVNDVHGHAAGDMLLVQISKRLREVVRTSDYLVRWGGEEFLVVARASDPSEGVALAERIVDAMARREFVINDELRLKKTCSVGFAAFPFFRTHPKLISWSQALEIADMGLRKAKDSGRNSWFGAIGQNCMDVDGCFQRLTNDFAGSLIRGEVREYHGGAVTAQVNALKSADSLV